MSTPLPNGNGNGSKALGGVIGQIVGVVAIIAAIVAPINQHVSNNERRIEKVESWQEDYSRGKIPSSAERDIAAIREILAEKETQLLKNLEFQTEKNRIFEKMIDELKTKK